MDKQEATEQIEDIKSQIEGVQAEAADKLLDLLDKLDESYEELERVYEVVAILHLIARSFLDEAKPDNEAEQQTYDLVQDAVEAMEFGITMSEARFVREEATEE